ncbi:flagellar protein FliO/FliZ [Collimonas sp. OK607]|uniref:flagellar biosynthetic protein FliO n=1 Tax=Collimonas sp. OK607 TaxID=1798194 RepID=UPI0008E0302B|nr:flagellar biosynthetic protein FliO [Collimonas sp. OK607]SFB22313.1 flagellar protein FliO/FliZ [Collimonas sp. OK607]
MKPLLMVRRTLLLLSLLPFVALPASAMIATPPAAVTATAAPSWGATGLLQAASGLAVVLALIFLCAWVARRLGLQKHNSGRLVKVIASTSIGQRERVVVVEIGGTWLALGVTPGQIQSLHTMPAQELAEEVKLPIARGAIAATNAASAFAQKLRESLGRK